MPGDIFGAYRDALMAFTLDEAAKIFAEHQAVMFQMPNHHLLGRQRFDRIAAALQIKMENMIPETESGNRGSLRHCVNDERNIYSDEYYNLFELMLEPGRWVFDLLKIIDPSLKFEKCGGDIVLPGADESSATQLHQDWTYL